MAVRQRFAPAPRHNTECAYTRNGSLCQDPVDTMSQVSVIRENRPIEISRFTTRLFTFCYFGAAFGWAPDAFLSQSGSNQNRLEIPASRNPHDNCIAYFCKLFRYFVLFFFFSYLSISGNSRSYFRFVLSILF